MKKLILTLALVVTSVFGLTVNNSYASVSASNKVAKVTAPTDQYICIYRECGAVTLKFTYDLDMRLVRVERVED